MLQFHHFLIILILPFLACIVRGLVDEENLALSSSSAPKSHSFVGVNDDGTVKNEIPTGDGIINWIISYWTTASILIKLRPSSGNEDSTKDEFLVPYPDRVRSAWAWSAFASIVVALTGVVPAIFIRPHSNARRKEGGERTLNRLLSFAVGSLLGDVFLHILPETWRYATSGSENASNWGMWVIFGSVLCFLVEKCASGAEDSRHKAAAFVNLCANAIDNFTHGLAVGASFSVSVKFGILTTFAILIHEIPHEISDFAILLRADFDRWSAIKAQLMTATGGVLGASVALIANGGAVGIEHKAACWILPFTAGGFLNVALVQVLPDLLKEKSVTESAMQLVYILFGVCLMGLISAVHI